MSFNLGSIFSGISSVISPISSVFSPITSALSPITNTVKTIGDDGLSIVTNLANGASGLVSSLSDLLTSPYLLYIGIGLVVYFVFFSGGSSSGYSNNSSFSPTYADFQSLASLMPQERLANLI
jgi:hypothetical protein